MEGRFGRQYCWRLKLWEGGVATPAVHKAHYVCLYVRLETASSCPALHFSTTPSCWIELGSQRVQSCSCPHQTQLLAMDTKMLKSYRHRLACRHKLHSHCHCLCACLELLSSGGAAHVGSMSRSSAPACHCQEWYCLDRCFRHHCARSPTQPSTQAELQQMWAATANFACVWNTLDIQPFYEYAQR